MQPHRVRLGRGLAWFGIGWQSFREQPAQWVALILLYVVILLALNLVPILGGMVSTVLTPAFGAGLLLAAHDSFQGKPIRLSHLFSGLTNPDSRLPLLILGGIALAATLLLAALYLGMVEVLPPVGTPPEQVPLPLESGLGGLAILILALVTGLAFYFAAPLVAFTSTGPVAAMGASLRGSFRNLPPILLFGLIYAVLAAIAAIPFGLGFLILAPVGVGAAYASFTEIFPEAVQGKNHPREDVLPA